MKPRQITQPDMTYWGNLAIKVVTFTSPAEIQAGVEPCEGVVTRDQIDGRFGDVVRVPWVLDEIELVHLAKGGTLWLSTWGGLPMHMLEVQPPAGGE